LKLAWPRVKGALALCLALWCGACSGPPEAPSAPQEPLKVIAAALALQPDPDRGREVFRESCIHCHGDQASGEPPTDFDLGDDNPRRFRGYAELSHREHIEAVVNGYVSKASGNQNMPAFAMRLTPQQIADVAAYEQRIMAQSGPYVEPKERSWMGLRP